jgi:cold shock protein
MRSMCFVLFYLLIGIHHDIRRSNPNRYRFGFIAQDAGGADLFAHFRDISGSGFKTLLENQRVEFEVKQGQKGLQAANIRVLA